VATPAAVRGIEGVAGEHYCTADTDEAFAAAVSGLLDDRERAREMAKRARALVVSRYTWERAAQDFESELQHAVQKGRAA